MTFGGFLSEKWTLSVSDRNMLDTFCFSVTYQSLEAGCCFFSAAGSNSAGFYSPVRLRLPLLWGAAGVNADSWSSGGVTQRGGDSVLLCFRLLSAAQGSAVLLFFLCDAAGRKAGRTCELDPPDAAEPQPLIHQVTSGSALSCCLDVWTVWMLMLVRCFCPFRLHILIISGIFLEWQKWRKTSRGLNRLLEFQWFRDPSAWRFRCSPGSAVVGLPEVLLPECSGDFIRGVTSPGQAQTSSDLDFSVNRFSPATKLLFHLFQQFLDGLMQVSSGSWLFSQPSPVRLSGWAPAIQTAELGFRKANWNSEPRRIQIRIGARTLFSAVMWSLFVDKMELDHWKDL